MKNTLPPLYPLKFEPILKKKVWGGDKLNQLFNKKKQDRIGESWEISGVENNISKVSEGELKDKELNWILENYQEELVGKEVYQKYGNTFPLLFKFIDASEILSVQVHPDDRLAQDRHNSFGKTEMWYILDSDSDAELIVGFKKDSNREEYLEALSNKELVSLLHCEKVHRGDAYVIHPGTVHAIGAGIVLAEIQQTSDITYRIYDWDRPDTDGNMRQLHTEEALEAINFSASDAKLEYNEQLNVPVLIGKTKFFEVNKITLSRPFTRILDFSDSFKVYMCIDGEGTMECNGFQCSLTKGQTLLIPAQLTEIKFHTSAASFLEVYIP